jgi:hypothetical protein
MLGGKFDGIPMESKGDQSSKFLQRINRSFLLQTFDFPILLSTRLKKLPHKNYQRKKKTFISFKKQLVFLISIFTQ